MTQVTSRDVSECTRIKDHIFEMQREKPEFFLRSIFTSAFKQSLKVIDLKSPEM